MMHDGRTTLRLILICLVVISIAGYSLFQSRKLIEGPVLSVLMPYDGQTIETGHIDITGNAANIAFMYLNGRKIFTDDKGVFHENVLLFPGYNVIELKAEDKFGKSVERQIRIYRKS